MSKSSNNEELHQLRKLLAKYWEATATSEDEAVLMHLVESLDINKLPEDLSGECCAFRALSEAMPCDAVPDDLLARVRKASVSQTRGYAVWRVWGAVAASVAMMATVAALMHSRKAEAVAEPTPIVASLVTEPPQAVLPLQDKAPSDSVQAPIKLIYKNKLSYTPEVETASEELQLAEEMLDRAFSEAFDALAMADEMVVNSLEIIND